MNKMTVEMKRFCSRCLKDIKRGGWYVAMRQRPLYEQLDRTSGFLCEDCVKSFNKWVNRGKKK